MPGIGHDVIYAGCRWRAPWVVAAAVLAISFVVAGCVREGGAGPSDDSDATAPRLEYHRLADLRVGECVDLVLEADDAELLAVVRRPCGGLHDAEVVGVAIHPTSRLAAYPGEAGLLTWAEHECLASIAEYVGVPYQDADLMAWYYVPSQSRWGSGDRGTQCLVTALGGERLERSVRGSGS